MADTRMTPPVVTASFWFWIASVVFSAVAVIITISNGTETMADAGGNAEVARAVAPVAAIVGIGIGGGLRVLFAVFLLRGRNWARIVLLILAILTALGTFATLTSGGVSGILALVATIVGAVLMYLPAANPYFRRA